LAIASRDTLVAPADTVVVAIGDLLKKWAPAISEFRVRAVI
jgi:hypothetical protein